MTAAHTHRPTTKPESIIIQVKGGKTGVKDVRDLRGVLDREKAAIGILISLQPPTKEMQKEAASAGFYVHKLNQQQFPKLQLRTVKELMEGKGIERPSSVAAVDETFKKAPVSKKKLGHQRTGLDAEPVFAGNSEEPMFHLTGLTAGQAYQIFLTAVNAGAESRFSAPVSAVVAGESEAAA